MPEGNTMHSQSLRLSPPIFPLLTLTLIALLVGCQAPEPPGPGAEPPAEPSAEPQPASLEQGASTESLALPPEVAAEAGWMEQVQASIAASERQPSWEDGEALLGSRATNLRGRLGTDGALRVSARSGGPLSG